MMHLGKAQILAQRIEDQLAVFCHGIQVAGSIRRRRPYVSDIDLVCIPKCLPEFQARCREHATAVIEGQSNCIYRLRDGTQLDVFIAHDRESDMFDVTPSNWGSVLLCRTGSKEHNIKIAQAAQRQGLKWETMRGLVDKDGRVVAGDTEGNILTCLGLPWIDPFHREV